ncbi:vWA domain-containing protein [Vallitalea pronyensis]|nr:VWA domain-containing protein [Vallitalea pronyensis]
MKKLMVMMITVVLILSACAAKGDKAENASDMTTSDGITRGTDTSKNNGAQLRDGKKQVAESQAEKPSAAKQTAGNKPDVLAVKKDESIRVTFNEDVTSSIGVDDGDNYNIVPAQPEGNTEAYAPIQENTYQSVLQNPLSTFSIDVDTASYSNIRRFLMDGQLPPRDAVRIEEMVNYFPYDYKEPEGKEPFAINSQIADCPWNDKHALAMVTLKAKDFYTENRPANNLVFLMDVSGSMNDPDKLPLLKSSFKLLVNQLDEQDKVSIVVYAGAAGVVLDATHGHRKDDILGAIEELNAGGSTAGGEGINLAYKIAEENYIKNGNNRIILATDGDFNVGPSSVNALTELIEENRKSGIFLSVLGFGKGNLDDVTAELLADKGNGNYAYIDTILEAKKVLVEQIGSTLYTVAKDVKYQLEFNPGKVKGYRLLGYENRLLNDEDFEDDTKDAGEVGAGHVVTAFYELIPADSNETIPGDDLKYQTTRVKSSDEWMTIKVRYKEPEGHTSQLIEVPVKDTAFFKPTREFYFASSVVEFGLLLRDSEYKGDASYENVIQRAKANKGDDVEGYRSEFIKMVELAKNLPSRY